MTALTQKLDKLAALATLNVGEEGNLARENEASNAARTLFRLCRDNAVRITFATRDQRYEEPRVHPWAWSSRESSPRREQAPAETVRAADAGGTCWICGERYRAGEPVFSPRGKATTHAGCGPL